MPTRKERGATAFCGKAREEVDAPRKMWVLSGIAAHAPALRPAGAALRARLHSWFSQAGRDLPWRRTRDPYAILVSEFMLQQTTVAAVIPYFERWMGRFPDFASLAAAAESEVLSRWQGLGYYSRARNLHAAARAVMERHGGVLPHDVEALRQLPGIGSYTAAAVASFAFDLPEPVIDANIARVLARLHNWRSPIDDTSGQIFLERAARELLPEANGWLHNSALMELGALICSSRNPRCLECPVHDDCQAESPEQLPVKRPRRAVTEVTEARALVVEEGRVWLQPSAGPRWRGLWILPLVAAPNHRPDHVLVHAITRYRVKLEVYLLPRSEMALEGFPAEALPPMPSPHRRAIAALLKTPAASI